MGEGTAPHEFVFHTAAREVRAIIERGHSLELCLHGLRCGCAVLLSSLALQNRRKRVYSFHVIGTSRELDRVEAPLVWHGKDIDCWFNN